MATWRRIPDTPYAASDEGEIRREEPGPGTKVGRILVQHLGGGKGGGYFRVSLSIDGKVRKENVHMLVACAFHGDRRNEGLTVDHIDEDTTRNVPSNLRWISGSTNYRNGARKRWKADVDPAAWGQGD